MTATMFRFTIRDVLLMTVVVGLGVGRWINHAKVESLADKSRELQVENGNLRDSILERYESVELTKWGWQAAEKSPPAER
jgi:hypothetical protein